MECVQLSKVLECICYPAPDVSSEEVTTKNLKRISDFKYIAILIDYRIWCGFALIIYLYYSDLANVWVAKEREFHSTNGANKETHCLENVKTTIDNNRVFCVFVHPFLALVGHMALRLQAICRPHSFPHGRLY